MTEANTATVNPASGATHIESPDGSVTISFGASAVDAKDSKFDDNLANLIDESELNKMGEEILRGVEEDIQSRADWESTFNRGLDLLGFKLEEAASEVTAGGNISKVYHPLLAEAVIRYAANAGAELLPSAGPVKVRDDTPEVDPIRVEMAEAFEKDFNHYLTVTRKEYYPDTERMLFAQGFCGNGFKKIYRCPIRKAPVSDYVAARDLIISNDALASSVLPCNATRVTHRTTMRHSVMKRMQLSGYYRDIPLGQPNSQPTTTEQKIGQIEGVSRQINFPADHPYTIYETYVEYDIPGFEHKDGDTPTGLPLPYRVTIDKDSRKVLEIRRNWKEGDEDYMARKRFVKYGYVPGFGFYDYGLVHLLGQTTRALTAIERQLIDAGQFSNFPGVLISDVGGRQETTQLRIPPGGCTVIKTGGLPITQVVMPLPYKEPSGVLVNIAKAIEDNGRRLGGTAEINVGEGRADVPVGTTIALIEQATKLEGAVHKRNHQSQQQEFLLLKELFEEEPEALSRFNKNPARQWQTAQEIMDQQLVPASDPNVPSHIHRVMKATALAQFAEKAPDINQRAVESIIIETIGYSPAALLNPVGMPAPGAQGDPAKLAKAQVDAAKVQEKKAATIVNAQLKAQEMQVDAANSEAERQSRERIQHMKTVGAIVQQQGQQKADLIKVAGGLRAKEVQQVHDRQHDLVESHIQHQHKLEAQAREHQHQKGLAESNNNVLPSEES